MKKADIPLRPTSYEKMILDQHLDMEEYWFDVLIKPKCRFVGSPPVYHELIKSTDQWTIHYANVYSVDAEKEKGEEGKVKEDCVYCFFIFFEGKVWKKPSVEGVMEVINLLDLEQKWNTYSSNLFQEKLRNERKAKGKLKSIGKRKKAA